MSLAYRLMYLVGFSPWDGAIPQELKDSIEGKDKLPLGRALDLGCGPGAKSVYMASHAWKVVGLDFVPRALNKARARAQAAGVTIDFRQTDVTRLGELGLEPGFSFLFDFGCFHGLRDSQRTAYAEGVNSLAASGARLLIMGFTKALPPVPSGISQAELEKRFPSWDFQWTHAVEMGGTTAMRRAEASWFCLSKRPG